MRVYGENRVNLRRSLRGLLGPEEDLFLWGSETDFNYVVRTLKTTKMDRFWTFLRGLGALFQGVRENECQIEKAFERT